MRLLSLKCQGFRCLSPVHFEPGPGLTVIRGGNAQGKTTLLEAVLFVTTSKSHRTNLEQDLVHHGEEHFQVKATAARCDREVRLEANWWKGVKRFKVNGVPQARVSDILGRIHVVFFSPEDVDLVKGGAAGRRRFLDMELSQVSPSYLSALQQYRQLLRQRNELLRGHAPDPDLLDVWDVQLAQAGAVLISERSAFSEEIAGYACSAYATIAQQEGLRVEYCPNVEKPEDLADVLQQARATDLRRRQTTRGPHRDDLALWVAERPARTFASQGQQKTAALALKLAELEWIKARVGEYPVLMLDEVLAELDAQRVRMLFEAIGEEVQCLMTTTVLSPSESWLGPETVNFRIERGCLEKA